MKERDFKKIYSQIENIKVELHILNSLVGSKNVEEDFQKLAKRYPEVLKCMPLFFLEKVTANSLEELIEKYVIIMRETGFFDILQNSLAENIVDFAFGIAVGLNKGYKVTTGVS